MLSFHKSGKTSITSPPMYLRPGFRNCHLVTSCVSSVPRALPQFLGSKFQMSYLLSLNISSCRSERSSLYFGDFCLFLGAPCSLGILVSQLRTEAGPPQWKLRVLNTGPPGCLVAQSCLTLCDPMDCSPPVSSVRGDSPGKNTGVGCHALLQESSQPRD